MHLKRRLIAYLLAVVTYSVFVVGDSVPPPADGLHGKSNYIFDAGGANFERLQATLYFETDLVSISNGAGFQLNCFSPVAGSTDGILVQQFGFQMLSDDDIYAFVETWTSSGPQIYSTFFVTSTSSQTIAAGSSFAVTLTTDGNNVVTEVTFAATINGVSFPVPSKDLESLTPTPAPGTDTDLAPINAFTFNIVGDDGGNTAVFSSGSGYVVFEASNAIGPLSDFPSNVAGAYTTEDGNSVYDQMEDDSETAIAQYWSVGGAD
jgi:hypothetical protein